MALLVIHAKNNVPRIIIKSFIYILFQSLFSLDISFGIKNIFFSFHKKNPCRSTGLILSKYFTVFPTFCPAIYLPPCNKKRAPETCFHRFPKPFIYGKLQFYVMSLCFTVYYIICLILFCLNVNFNILDVFFFLSGHLYPSFLNIRHQIFGSKFLA